MKLFGLGVPELLIILVVVLLIFGPKHLPKLGAALGSTVKNLREGLGGSSNAKATQEEVIQVEEIEEEPEPHKVVAAPKKSGSSKSVAAVKKKTEKKTPAKVAAE